MGHSFPDAISTVSSVHIPESRDTAITCFGADCPLGGNTFPLGAVMRVPPLLASCLLLSLWASFRTKSAFNKYSKVRVATGMTGAQAAQRLLDSAGIRDVKIVPHQVMLTDHYNPITKTLALSEQVFGVPSISAVGVACHEAGHAIQHATKYAPLWLAFLNTAIVSS